MADDELLDDDVIDDELEDGIDEEDVDDEAFDDDLAVDEVLAPDLDVDVDVLEEEEEEDDEPDDRGEPGTKIVPRRENEFLCKSCFLVLPRHQLADEKRMICRDCA